MCSRFLIVVSALLSVSCSASRSESHTVQSVKVADVVSVEYINRDFAGMATADDAVNLAFKISGQVASCDVSKGDFVQRGALLATLDPRDVELQVASDRSQYEMARSQYERVRRLMEYEAVSKQEYEAAEASFVRAQSAYENSKDLLSDTYLRAPFSGVIERVYVDTYQRVQSGETILRLVNPRSTTIEFTMPEKSLPLLADTTSSFSVTFDNIPDRRFSARLHKYAKTSSDAYGFPVALKISKADSELYGISPGMTCQVTMRCEAGNRSQLAVPLSAVYAPAAGGTYVWVVTADNRAERRSVVLGNIFGRDMVAVVSGLKSGERVATAGVYKLQEGVEVKVVK